MIIFRGFSYNFELSTLIYDRVMEEVGKDYDNQVETSGIQWRCRN